MNSEVRDGLGAAAVGHLGDSGWALLLHASGHPFITRVVRQLAMPYTIPGKAHMAPLGLHRARLAGALRTGVQQKLTASQCSVPARLSRTFVRSSCQDGPVRGGEAGPAHCILNAVSWFPGGR